MKKIVPFSNGSEAMKWQSRNCDICQTRRNCPGKNGIDYSFAVGSITEKTAEFIGRQGENGILDDCQWRHKRIVPRYCPPVKVAETDTMPTLF